jgi:hypothetical protein
VQLLRAASEVVGGNRALAGRLGISEALLAKFVADTLELPDPLLLCAVDIILAERQSGISLHGQPTISSGGLRSADETPQNGGRGSGATTPTGHA